MSKQQGYDIVDGVRYRYDAAWIYALENQDHWQLYWQQQKVMQGYVKAGQHVLEIGVGSGFTANYLRSKGVLVDTIDIDAEKKPDIVANIVTYDFENAAQKYDHILAFEVFEHIPFDEFSNLLPSLRKVRRGCLFLSVPRNEKVLLRLDVTLPVLGRRKIEFAMGGRNRNWEYHFWEVDDGKISRDQLERTFSEHNFCILSREKQLSRIFYVIKAEGLI